MPFERKKPVNPVAPMTALPPAHTPAQPSAEPQPAKRSTFRAKIECPLDTATGTNGTSYDAAHTRQSEASTRAGQSSSSTSSPTRLTVSTGKSAPSASPRSNASSHSDVAESSAKKHKDKKERKKEKKEKKRKSKRESKHHKSHRDESPMDTGRQEARIVSDAERAELVEGSRRSPAVSASAEPAARAAPAEPAAAAPAAAVPAAPAVRPAIAHGDLMLHPPDPVDDLHDPDFRYSEGGSAYQVAQFSPEGVTKSRLGSIAYEMGGSRSTDDFDDGSQRRTVNFRSSQESAPLFRPSWQSGPGSVAQLEQRRSMTTAMEFNIASDGECTSSDEVAPASDLIADMMDQIDIKTAETLSPNPTRSNTFTAVRPVSVNADRSAVRSSEGQSSLGKEQLSAIQEGSGQSDDNENNSNPISQPPDEKPSAVQPKVRPAEPEPAPQIACDKTDPTEKNPWTLIMEENFIVHGTPVDVTVTVPAMDVTIGPALKINLKDVNLSWDRESLRIRNVLLQGPAAKEWFGALSSLKVVVYSTDGDPLEMFSHMCFIERLRAKGGSFSLTPYWTQLARVFQCYDDPIQICQAIVQRHSISQGDISGAIVNLAIKTPQRMNQLREYVLSAFQNYTFSADAAIDGLRAMEGIMEFEYAEELIENVLDIVIDIAFRYAEEDTGLAVTVMLFMHKMLSLVPTEEGADLIKNMLAEKEVCYYLESALASVEDPEVQEELTFLKDFVHPGFLAQWGLW